MNAEKLRSRFLAVLLLTSAASLSGCGDDDKEPKAEIGEYKLLTLVPNSDGQTSAYYLQTLNDINQTGTVDNSKSVELTPATGAGAYTHEGIFYLNDYAVGKIQKWEVNPSTGSLTKTGEMSTTDLGYAGNMLIRDETTGFIGASNVFKIAIFNPATMQRTGFIDLTAHSHLNEVTNFPAEGAKVNSQAISEVIIRGNYLYAGVFYFDTFSTYTPTKNACYILVIDLTKVDPNSSSNADAFVKEISDDRGSFTGAWNSGVGSNFMIKDENNDLYVLCHNMWAGQRATTGKPACVLRIKDGETEFDQDYYYNIEDVSQGSGNPVMGLEYHKGGKFYAAVMDPAQLDPENPISYYVDPIFKWWQFDLYNTAASARLIDTPSYCKAASSTNCYFEGDHAYIPFADNSETYVLQVNTNTLEQKNLFNTNGTPFLFKEN